MKLRHVIPVLLLAPQVLWAAVPYTNDLGSARSAGTNSLTTLRALVTPANYYLLGFQSNDEALQATNAEPLLIYVVVHTNLLSYHPGQSFEPLLESTPRHLIIPVMVATNVRSSITLRAIPSAPGAPLAWTNASWGQKELIRDLMGTYRSIPNAEVKSGTSPFFVEMPVFSVWLVGYYNSQDKLILRATVDMRLEPVTVHRNEIITEAAMYQLAIIAQRYNGLPN